MAPYHISSEDYLADPAKYGSAPSLPKLSRPKHRRLGSIRDDTETTPSLGEGPSSTAESEFARHELFSSTTSVPSKSGNLRQHSLSDAATTASLTSISHEVNSMLNSSGEHDVVFRVRWSLRTYVNSYLAYRADQQQSDVLNILRQSVVLMDKVDVVCATTAANFMQSQWNAFAQKCDTLQLLSKAMTAKGSHRQSPSFFCFGVTTTYRALRCLVSWICC